MNLIDLKPSEGAKKEAFRKGRGHASGNGKTAGRGQNGQKSRSGGGVRAGFEGGQMPLYRRLPKRGIKKKTHRNFVEIVSINVDRLNIFEDGQTVNIAAQVEAGVISNPRDGVKILGQGELTKKLTVKVGRYSESAKAKIEALGGTAE